MVKINVDEAIGPVTEHLMEFLSEVIASSYKRTIRRDFKPVNLNSYDIIYVIRNETKMFNKVARNLIHDHHYTTGCI